MLVPLERPTRNVQFSRESDVRRLNPEMVKSYENALNNLLKIQKMLEDELFQSRRVYRSDDEDNEWEEYVDGVVQECKRVFKKVIELKKDILSVSVSIKNVWDAPWWR